MVLLGSAMVLSAAEKSAPTFSGRYKNKPVKEVLADLKSQTGVSVRLQRKQVSSSRKVTVAFRNATPDEVLETLFDCKHQITQVPVKKGKSKKYEVSLRDLSPKEQVVAQFARDTTVIDTRVVAQQELEAEQLTVLTRQRMAQVRVEDSVEVTQDRIVYHTTGGETQTPTRLGFHSLQAYVGGAYSSLGYKLDGGVNMGGFGAEVSVRYAYFFNDNWALSGGLDYDTYQSYGRLNDTHRWDGQTDSEGEQYNHLALTHNWTESQRIHELSIPVMAEYQYRLNDQLGVFCALGAYVGFPLAASYDLRKGALEHQGEYTQWGMVLNGVAGHDFYTEHIGRDFSRDKHSLALKKITVGVKADVGALVALTDAIDLFAGVYAKVDALDIAPEEKSAALGWSQPEATAAYRQHTFMPTYCGLVASEQTNVVRPYEVGIKVGIHFRPGAPQRKPKEQTICEVLTDTTYRWQTHYDTITTQQVDTIVSLHRTLNKSVIWFAVNDYEHPRIQPADLLDQVAEILLANPSQHVAINGHASAEGNARANQQLSDRRAATITRMLIERGVPSEQITTNGYSSRVDYVRDADTDAAAGTGRTAAELNRRVEIVPVKE